MTEFSDDAMFEAGFDCDIASERLREMLKIFPAEQEVLQQIYRFRETNHYIDLKRGELYPEVIGAGTRLRRTVAQIYGVADGDRLTRAQPNFGCNGCIETIFAAVRNAEDGERIRRGSSHQAGEDTDFGGCVVATPTYFRYYHSAQAKKIRFLEVPQTQWNVYPVEEVLRSIRENDASLLILVSPNNPTGVPLRDTDIETLMANVPETVNVVIDRTCVNLQAEISTKELISRYKGRRLGIFHSFSKYKGMSHLRIGFAVYASQELAAETERYVPFGLNLEAALKATHILQQEGELTPDERVITNIRQNQELMKTFTRKHSTFVCSDFQSNYALLRLPEGQSSEAVCKKALSRGVFVMGGHQFPVPDNRFIRLHVGGPPEWLETLLEAVGE